MRNPFSLTFWLKTAGLITVLAAMTPTNAAVFVDYRGSDSNPGTASQPVKSIGQGIALAQSIDAVVVANGVYTGPNNRNLDPAGKSLHIRSLNGAANCIIDCQGQGRAFVVHLGETTNMQISGFTIQNGHAPDGIASPAGDGAGGGAVEIINSSPTIKECVFISNTAGNGGMDSVAGVNGGDGGYGGAIYIDGGSPLMLNCIFLSNTAGNGGNGSAAVPPTMSGNGGNGGSGGAIDVNSGSPQLVNCTFVLNQSGMGGAGGDSSGAPASTGLPGNGGNGGDGGAIAFSSSDVSVVTNCTVVANTAGSGGAGGTNSNLGANGSPGAQGFGSGLADNSANSTIYNSILAFNTGGDLFGGTVSYSDVGASANSTDGGNNIQADPLFVRIPRTLSPQDYGDLHLTGLSPCLNAGDVSAPGILGVDLDLKPRIQRGGVDLGAYELANTKPFLSQVSPSTVAVGGPAFTLTLTGSNFNLTSIVKFNGVMHSSHFVSPTMITVDVAASEIASPVGIKIIVVNPLPVPDGGNAISQQRILIAALPTLTLSTGTLTRNATTGEVTIPVYLNNTGSVTANNVSVTAATLHSVATTSTLPISIGTFSVGSRRLATLTFPGTVGGAGKTVALSVTTSFQGGTATSTLNVVLP